MLLTISPLSIKYTGDLDRPFLLEYFSEYDEAYALQPIVEPWPDDNLFCITPTKCRATPSMAGFADDAIACTSAII